MKDLLKKLTSIPAISGDEKKLTDFVYSHFKSLNFATFRDDFGNVWAYNYAAESHQDSNIQNTRDPDVQPDIMFEAHIDEVGFMVTKVCDNGFIKVAPVGGVDPGILQNIEVVIHTKNGDIPGVFCSIPPHLKDKTTDDKPPQIKDLYIDTFGVTSIEIGDYVSYIHEFSELTNDTFASKSLDNRVGIALLLKIAEYVSQNTYSTNNPPKKIAFLASVQEEVGCRGAAMGGYKILPKKAIVIDVTHGISPNVTAEDDAFKLDSGVAIGAGATLDKQIFHRLKELATNANIPYTVEVCGANSGTNAWSLQNLAGGIPCGLISIPLRYMHSPSEVAQLYSIDSTLKLMQEVCQNGI
ncbi:MAG: hypothetical protein LBM38_05430 [Clostridiales bacterium]|jgi:endoglucanase|nr:hypothetical protein [Clostridiales bacterium]